MALINRHSMARTSWLVALLVVSLATTLVASAGEDQSAPDPPTDEGSAPAMTAGRQGEQIEREVISSGASDAGSVSFHLLGTVAQSAVGSGSSASFGISHGYWQGPVEGSCCLLRGDINHDGAGPDITDLVFLVEFMFQPGSPAPPCEEPVGSGYYPEADVDGNGVGPDIADLVYLVSYMFQPPSPAPIPCP